MSSLRVAKTYRLPSELAAEVAAKVAETQQSENEWVVLALRKALDAETGGEGLLSGLLLERALARAAEKGMGLAEWMAKVAEWALTVAENPAKRITTLREPIIRPDPDSDSPKAWENYYAELRQADWELMTPVERADLKDFKAGRNPARRLGQES